MSPDLSDQPVTIPAGEVDLRDLRVPENAAGVVLFAHGSGSGRRSPRNRMVAAGLGDAGLATVLIDLLTEAEEARRRRAPATCASTSTCTPSGRRRDRLAGRRRAHARAAARAVRRQHGGRGGARRRRPATRPGRRSRFARWPPRPGGPLPGPVRAPTLLIVGSKDTVVVELNRKAQTALAVETALEVVPGATHLFRARRARARARRGAGLVSRQAGRHGRTAPPPRSLR